MNMQQMGSLAAAAGPNLNALISKISIGAAATGSKTNASSDVTFDARHHIKPTDTYEARQVIHPAARYQARQVLQYNSESDVTTVPTHKTKMGNPLPRPTATNAASETNTEAASKPRVLNNHKGTLLDMFI